jgi:hypothetical protein
LLVQGNFALLGQPNFHAQVVADTNESSSGNVTVQQTGTSSNGNSSRDGYYSPP